MLKLPLKSFAIKSPQPEKQRPKLILSLKKCHKKPLLADNDPFPNCASWHSVAHVDILIKKIATVRMDLLVNFPSWLFQDVTGVKWDILVILEGPQKQLWGCGAGGRRRRQQRVFGTHHSGSTLHSTCSTWSETWPTDMENWSQKSSQKFQCTYHFWW